jgi:hypothetical protein
MTMSTATARSVRHFVFTATLIALPWICAAQDATGSVEPIPPPGVTVPGPAQPSAPPEAAPFSAAGQAWPPAEVAPVPAAGEPLPPPEAAPVSAAAPPSPQDVAPGPAQAEKPAPDGFRMGAFTFKPGGRVKLDVIRDFEPIGSEDYFDTRTIPVDDSEGTNSNIHAKETRLNLDIRGDVEGQELRMFIETDFYGTSSALRLRHAYGTWGGLLAGQTWTTFMDDDNLPRTIDFEAPTAFAQIRQAQARWTEKAGWLTWSAAVEDNKSAILLLTDIPGDAEYPSPDFVGRVRFDFPRGHLTTSGFVGAAAFRPALEDAAGNTDRETVTLWGSMASVKFLPFGKDSAYSVVTYGEGIGRYRGGVTAVLDQNGELHPAGARAFMGGYEHFWAERWSSNGVYSVAETVDEAFYTSLVNKRLEYGAINLLYWFLGDRAWTGVEYLYGSREVFGGGEDTGSAHRVQYAVRFNLP